MIIINISELVGASQRLFISLLGTINNSILASSFYGKYFLLEKMNKAPLRVTLLFRPKAPNQEPARDAVLQALQHSNDEGLTGKRCHLSISGLVNNVQVKFKFENRKERVEMLPGSLLATPLCCLRDEVSQTLA